MIPIQQILQRGRVPSPHRGRRCGQRGRVRLAPCRCGSLFVAMHGGTTDGNRYIRSAVKQGAVAVVTDSAAAFDAAAREFPQMALVEVAHGRKALAGVAANFFDIRKSKLALSGVTGNQRQDDDCLSARCDAEPCCVARRCWSGRSNIMLPSEVRSVAAYHAGISRSAGALCRGSQPGRDRGGDGGLVSRARAGSRVGTALRCCDLH